MNLYMDYSHASARTHLNDAKRELIALMASEKQIQRELSEITDRVAEYEKYAKDALDIGEESLAREIAEKIAAMESRSLLQEKENDRFTVQVHHLKDAVGRLERRLAGPDDRLQYVLDYLDAAAELRSGGDLELQRKMHAAGIGKRANSGNEILARIRANRC